MVEPWRKLLIGITLALTWLAVSSCSSIRQGDASVAAESGHGRVVDEGMQAIFVSGKNSNCF